MFVTDAKRVKVMALRKIQEAERCSRKYITPHNGSQKERITDDKKGIAYKKAKGNFNKMQFFKNDCAIHANGVQQRKKNN